MVMKMATASTSDTYAHGRNEGEFDTPDYAASEFSAYAVPVPIDGRDTPWNDEQGWAPHVGAPTPASTPDPYRLGAWQGNETVPHAGVQEDFYAPLDADKARRSSVEFQDADGWEENKAYSGYPLAAAGANRWARNPRETPPDEPRPTTRMAPRTYVFMRPFMTGQAKMGKRDLNGMHFSFANFRRDYPINGMEPPKSRRNTYRIDPTPWDVGLTDLPPSNAPMTSDYVETPQTTEVSYSSRSWRL